MRIDPSLLTVIFVSAMNADCTRRASGLRRSLAVRHFLAERDAGFGAEPLVILILHDHADALGHIPEVQNVVRVGVNREPVLAVDLLAIGFKFRELIILSLIHI